MFCVQKRKNYLFFFHVFHKYTNSNNTNQKTRNVTKKNTTTKKIYHNKNIILTTNNLCNTNKTYPTDNQTAQAMNIMKINIIEAKKIMIIPILIKEGRKRMIIKKMTQKYQACHLN